MSSLLPDDPSGEPTEPRLSPDELAEALQRLCPAGDPLAQLDVLQQQLTAVREQLTESQRLATIGTISSVIAHEFNNILTPIVSYAQFALTSAESDTPDMPLIRKALSKAYQSSTKAGKICASMLALARGESSFGPVLVQRLVDETFSVLARDPQKDGIALRVQVQPGLMVVGDAVQLEQVLLNLLINARHALLGHSRNGAITIKASAVDDEDVKIQVIDNGPGIPAHVQSRIFEPFFTTKATAKRGEAKGSGLGLAICREILTHHKGRIEVESTVGKGTTFTLWMPAAGAGAVDSNHLAMQD
ncbi:MAG: histidine kinase [Marmoricola sp.]|nr:histidine kinase [Marmoricola sp.]